MLATTIRAYGSTDLLSVEDIDLPTPADDEVLVRVAAASVNSWDWDNLCGTPFYVRLLMGMFRPKFTVPGCDVAGRVTQVGRNVTRFAVGDEVFGDLSGAGWGTFAEYVCAPADALEPKPASASFEQAAAMPQAAVMALQGIRDYGDVGPGDRVLINGAGGGVGTFAIQIAKMRGAHVTGVDRTDKLDFMRSVGADDVVDYTAEDYTEVGESYDLILDVVGRRSMFDHARALKQGGIYVMVGGPPSRLIQMLLVKRWLSRVRNKRMEILVHEPNKDLAALSSMLDDGSLVPVIDGPYPLADVALAMRQVGEGRVRGKVVITV